MNLRTIAFLAATLAVVIALVVLLPRFGPGGQNAAKRAADATAHNTACVVNPYIERSRGIAPAWQPLAPQADRSTVFYNPFTMSCDPATGRRLVWTEVRYPFEREQRIEDAQTIQILTFTRERYLYEIDCASKSYEVLEHAIMAEGDSAAFSEKYRSAGGALKAPTAGGLAETLAGPACSTGRI